MVKRNSRSIRIRKSTYTCSVYRLLLRRLFNTTGRGYRNPKIKQDHVVVYLGKRGEKGGAEVAVILALTSILAILCSAWGCLSWGM